MSQVVKLVCGKTIRRLPLERDLEISATAAAVASEPFKLELNTGNAARFSKAYLTSWTYQLSSASKRTYFPTNTTKSFFSKHPRFSKY